VRHFLRLEWSPRSLDEISNSYTEWQLSKSSASSLRELIAHLPTILGAAHAVEELGVSADEDVTVMAEGVMDAMLAGLRVVNELSQKALGRWERRMDVFYATVEGCLIHTDVRKILLQVDGRPGGSIGAGFLVEYDKRRFIATAGHVVNHSKDALLSYRSQGATISHRMSVRASDYPEVDLAILEAPDGFPGKAIPVPSGDVLNLSLARMSCGAGVTIYPLSYLPDIQASEALPGRTGTSVLRPDGRIMVTLGDEEKGWSGCPALLELHVGLPSRHISGEVLAGVMVNRKVDQTGGVSQSTGAWLEPASSLVALLRRMKAGE
jgi:hypothetical protein